MPFSNPDLAYLNASKTTSSVNVVPLAFAFTFSSSISKLIFSFSRDFKLSASACEKPIEAIALDVLVFAQRNKHSILYLATDYEISCLIGQSRNAPT